MIGQVGMQLCVFKIAEISVKYNCIDRCTKL